jgi:hypothetical protein
MIRLLRVLTDCIGGCFGSGCEWCAYGWTPDES